MILQSRKWRMLIRTITLVISSVLMLVFAAPASYALQDDTPKPVTRVDQLFSKEKPLTDSYVHTSAVPDYSHTIVTHDGSTTYYWIPLGGYDNELFVRAEGEDFLRAYKRSVDMDPGNSPKMSSYYGKLTKLDGQAGSETVIKELASQGIQINKDKTMVLLHGEEPRTYRPIVPVWGILALLWGLALVGLVRIWRGRRPRRPRMYASPTA